MLKVTGNNFTTTTKGFVAFYSLLTIYKEKDNIMYKCEICGKELSSQGKLIRHIKNVHSLSKEEYHINYLNKNNEHKCSITKEELFDLYFNQ